jgi:hypothetical protein
VHFCQAEEYVRDTGTAFVLMLNEYADLTEEEYNTSSITPFAESSRSSAPLVVDTPQVVVEDRIRTAYAEWCQYFNKAMEESRLEIFSMHFCEAEEYVRDTGAALFLMLNEYADLTEEEYNTPSITPL